MDGFYDNTGYVNKRNRKQVLILDVSDEGSETFLGAGTEFSVDLFEPLKIDTLSEVYLDNFISFNSNITNITANSAFVLRINEFNISSNVASSTNNNEIFNSIVIPNEHSSVADNHGVVLHKAKKFNYVCDINPGKISNISGKITNLAGEPMFHSNGSTYKFTYALTGIDNGSASYTGGQEFPIEANTEFTACTGFTTGSGAAGQFLATHFSTLTTLHFSSETELTLEHGSGGNGTPITFTVGSGKTYTILNPSSSNVNLTLIKHPGRFIAEFSINSRE